MKVTEQFGSTADGAVSSWRGVDQIKLYISDLEFSYSKDNFM